MPAVEWRAIPTVPFADEMLDKAFSKAKRVADAVDDPNRTFRVRKQMKRMVQSSADTISTALLEQVERWPSTDHLSAFDHALVDAAVGLDDYRHNLSMLQWGAKRIRAISSQNVTKITRTANTELMHAARREAYGRISSIMRQISASLSWLNETREILKRLPSIDEMNPCIVIAGAPNVGKSALITAMSSGKPEVAIYPFTTKRLHLGHFIHRRLKYQLVDTPGLLDRPMEKRNQIEMQAIAALEHSGSIVLFILDPTGHSGADEESQENLLQEVRGLLTKKEIIVVETKADLLDERPQEWDAVKSAETDFDDSSPVACLLPMMLNPLNGNIQVSAEEEVGLISLREMLVSRISDSTENDPLTLPANWHRSDIRS